VYSGPFLTKFAYVNKGALNYVKLFYLIKGQIQGEGRYTKGALYTLKYGIYLDWPGKCCDVLKSKPAQPS